MANVVGDIAVSVGADIGPLQKEMKKGTKSIKGFGKDFAAMGKKIAKVGAGIASAMALAGAGIIAAGKKASAAAKEIDNLSRVANAGAVEFQKMAVASKSVGIEQEKLSDILKDVNDRVGDFVTTGGGPMKDFFEQIAPAVGVTADQFARLSGPEALQLFYNSLEKANLNQQEMTFYMEAMASDATSLIPILRNGGLAIKQLGDEAERTGRILDQDMIDAGVELDKVLGDAADTIKNSFNVALLENADAIAEIAAFIESDLIPAMSAVVGVIGEIVAAVSSGIGAMREFWGVASGISGKNPTNGADIIATGDYANNTEGTGQGGTGMQLDANGNLPPITSTANTGPAGGTSPWQNNSSDYVYSPSSGGGSSRGGGGRSGGGSRSGLDAGDLERFKEQFAAEQELIQTNYEQSMEKLREFREAKLGTEEEFNALEKQIQQQHQEDMAAMERQQQQARMQAMAGALGDLSSLMQTNSKKMFAIGKAAATAEAVVSGYQAAVDAWQKGMKIGGPPVAAAFTAASLAKTGALISGIQSQQFGGGASSASAGTAATGTAAAETQSAQTVNISGLDASQLYSGEALIGIFDGLADVAKDRGVRFVVT